MVAPIASAFLVRPVPLLCLLRLCTQRVERHDRRRKTAPRYKRAIGEFLQEKLLAKTPCLELDRLLCRAIERVRVLFQALPGAPEVRGFFGEHFRRVLPDLGVVFEAGSPQEPLETFLRV